MLAIGACRIFVATTLQLFPGGGAQSVDFARVPLKASHFYEVRAEVTFYTGRGGPAALEDVGFTYAMQVPGYTLANWSSTEAWAAQLVDASDRPGNPPVLGVEPGETRWTHDHDLGSTVVTTSMPPKEPLFGLRVNAGAQFPPAVTVAWHHRGRASFLTGGSSAELVFNVTRDEPVGSVFLTWYPSIYVTECAYSIPSAGIDPNGADRRQ